MTSDVISFKVEDVIFVASKSHLVSASDYFEALLFGKFEESHQSQIKLPGIDATSFRLFLDWAASPSTFGN